MEFRDTLGIALSNIIGGEGVGKELKDATAGDSISRLGDGWPRAK